MYGKCITNFANLIFLNATLECKFNVDNGCRAQIALSNH